MIRTPFAALVLALAAALALAVTPRPAAAVDPVPRHPAPDTLRFVPSDSEPPPDDNTSLLRMLPADETGWRRAPYGDDLIMHPGPWRRRFPTGALHGDLLLDYNRVDLVRYGAWLQLQRPETMRPRAAARLEYATGRRRVLYGVQLEQPLLPTARFVAGADLSRRTDHGDLQQFDDVENSLLLLFAHEDWRDYFEREGGGGYLSWRVPNFSTVSAHLRTDRFRSLAASPHVVSWWHRERDLRANPAIDEGQAKRAIFRLERLARPSRRNRGGLYHWIELENAGGRLGGDFEYTRALADLRSVIRLSPSATFNVRAVGGSVLHGTLPAERRFTLGGADGPRAHPVDFRNGDRVALAQVEYGVTFHGFGTHVLAGGPQVIGFVDTGTAWDRGAGGELAAQRFTTDGGVAIGTPDDDLRVTFARSLQDTHANIVVTLRLRRAF